MKTIYAGHNVELQRVHLFVTSELCQSL